MPSAWCGWTTRAPSSIRCSPTRSSTARSPRRGARSCTRRSTFDAGGHLLTGTLMDYAIPRADERARTPRSSTCTQPSPRNTLGAKGLGEAGNIGIPPAVVNAVVDALSPVRRAALDMPLTPERLWRAIGGRRAVTVDRVGGVALALLVATVWSECRRCELPLGSLPNPGPAYMPTLLAGAPARVRRARRGAGGRRQRRRRGRLGGVAPRGGHPRGACGFTAFALERLGLSASPMAVACVFSCCVRRAAGPVDGGRSSRRCSRRRPITSSTRCCACRCRAAPSGSDAGDARRISASASRSRCRRRSCSTRSSAAWSARWSACCRAWDRSRASACLLPATFGLERHPRHRHAGRHLLRRDVRWLDHVDPHAHSRRGGLGDDVHRRLRDGAQGTRGGRARHRRGRLLRRGHRSAWSR